MRVAGVMSGTSLDGIDVAIVEIAGRHLETIGFQSTPYSAATRAAILAVSDTATQTSAISRLNFQLGELYARAVLRAVRSFGAVRLIGCHGQTIYHEGASNTLQIGEAAVIAERTGVPVVSNFRARATSPPVARAHRWCRTWITCSSAIARARALRSISAESLTSR